jgi:RNA polymerase sigma factor (sigma-70 family)
MTEDPFVAHRSLLFTVAYELLGSAADAEDVLQESWLRWADVDQSQVHDPRAYLIRVITRQALNQMRTVSRRREDYVGEWLPEPLLTSPDVAEDVELAESVSMAMLTVLETLEATERAVFVLHQVFDMSYGEIAEAIGKSTAAVRQIAWRAREHVAARRPRGRVSQSEQKGRGGAVPERAANRAAAGLDGGHGTGRGADRRWWWPRAGGSDSHLRGRTGSEVARARGPDHGRFHDDAGVAQRCARGPDRGRRPAGRGEPGGRERAGHADLRRGKPTEADAPG